MTNLSVNMIGFLPSNFLSTFFFFKPDFPLSEQEPAVPLVWSGMLQDLFQWWSRFEICCDLGSVSQGRLSWSDKTVLSSPLSSDHTSLITLGKYKHNTEQPAPSQIIHMKIYSAVCLPLLFFLVFQANAENEAESEEGTDRVFPLIPIFPFLLPYTNVDLVENWNKLKTERNALYFLVRDTITVS